MYMPVPLHGDQALAGALGRGSVFAPVKKKIGKPDLCADVIGIAVSSIFVWVLGNILLALGLPFEIAPALGHAFLTIDRTMVGEGVCTCGRVVRWVDNITN